MLKKNLIALKMTKTVKNSAQLLLFLVNDMLDVYMLKNGKFQMIEEKFVLKKMIEEIFDMFSLQTAYKGIKLKRNCSINCPYGISTDQRRLK